MPEGWAQNAHKDCRDEGSLFHLKGAKLRVSMEQPEKVRSGAIPSKPQELSALALRFHGACSEQGLCFQDLSIVVLGIESMALYMLSKCSTTELHASPLPVFCKGEKWPHCSC